MAEFVTLAHVATLAALLFGYCLTPDTSTMSLTWWSCGEITLNGGGITLNTRITSLTISF
jgi:hypothetical protein